MKKIKFQLYSAIVLALSATVAMAQPANQYFLEALPQSFYLNPAKKQESSFHFDYFLPMSVQASSTGFTFSDLVTDSTLTLGSITDGLDANNSFSLIATKHLANFGFTVKRKNYFSYNASFKMVIDLNYSKDFMSVLTQGNAPGGVISDTPVNLDGTRYNIMGYLEHGFGYSREVNEKLIIGGRLKFLQGGFNANGNFDGVSIETAQDLSSMTINSSLALKSANMPGDSASFGDLLSNAGNSGFAIDLGGSYEVNDKLTLFGSLLDLGSITWGSDSAKTSSNNGVTFVFEGLTTAQLTDTSKLNNFTDSVSDLFKLTDSIGSYTVNLPTRFFVGGTYKFTKKLSGNALYSGRIANGQLASTIVVGAGWKPSRWFESQLSYTMTGGASNIGLGAVLNLGAWQLYFITDNIGGLMKVDKTKNLSASLGMNFTWGRKKHFEREEEAEGKGTKNDKKDSPKKDATKKDEKKDATKKKVEKKATEAPKTEAPASKPATTPVVKETPKASEVTAPAVSEEAPKAVESSTPKSDSAPVTDAVKETPVAPAVNVKDAATEKVKEAIKKSDPSVVPAVAPAAADKSVIEIAEEDFITGKTDSLSIPVTDSLSVPAIDSLSVPVSDSLKTSITAPVTEAVEKKVEEIKTKATDKVKELPSDIKEAVTPAVK